MLTEVITNINLVDLRDLLGEKHKAEGIRHAHTGGDGRLWYEAGLKKLEHVQNEIDKNPRIDTEEIRKDIRFLLGFLAGIQYMTGLPAGVNECLNKEENKEIEG